MFRHLSFRHPSMFAFMSLLSVHFGPRFVTLLASVDQFVHVLPAFLKDSRILSGRMRPGGRVGRPSPGVTHSRLAQAIHSLDLYSDNHDIPQQGNRETRITKTGNNTDMKALQSRNCDCAKSGNRSRKNRRNKFRKNSGT